MAKIAIAIHGGACNETADIRHHADENIAALTEALKKGYQVLKRGGTALRAVEAAVIILEDNPLFNAGRGSALNKAGEVEMDASIMDGRTLKAGAVSMVRSVKNPIVLARTIMSRTKHVMLSGYGALDLANLENIQLESDAYFITDFQYQQFQKKSKHATVQKIVEKKVQDTIEGKLHGTVGAVALDAKGNLAAATSTGGTSNSLPGRIGDSCIIGAGCYANNSTCAVSGTGQGELFIRGVIAHSISSLIELKKLSLQKACDQVIHKGNKNLVGEMGVIAIDYKGNICFSFNTRAMRRGCIRNNGEVEVKLFKNN